MSAVRDTRDLAFEAPSQHAERNGSLLPRPRCCNSDSQHLTEDVDRWMIPMKRGLLTSHLINKVFDLKYTLLHRGLMNQESTLIEFSKNTADLPHVLLQVITWQFQENLVTYQIKCNHRHCNALRGPLRANADGFSLSTAPRNKHTVYARSGSLTLW